MITKQTAYDIWIAYDEIAKSEKLLADMEQQRRSGESINLRDSFGRPQNLQLGVPSGDRAQRLFDVSPSLAAEVIKAHIANKRAELGAMQDRARGELESCN